MRNPGKLAMFLLTFFLPMNLEKWYVIVRLVKCPSQKISTLKPFKILWVLLLC